jgi:phage anti-repressor protein
MSKLKFNGIFKDKEKELRITEDNMVSVFDVIKLVKNNKYQKSVWNSFISSHPDCVEIASQVFNKNVIFQDNIATPVIDVYLVVKLLRWIPSKNTKEFIETSGENLIKHLGGGINSVKELKKVDKPVSTQPIAVLENLRDPYEDFIDEQKDVVSSTTPAVYKQNTVIVADVPGPSSVDTRTTLPDEIQTLILEEIDRTFTEDEKMLYINSLKMYIKYDQIRDFVVNLESVYSLMGFTRLDHAKKVIISNFVENIDYIYVGEVVNKAPAYAGALIPDVNSKVRGCAGKNKETVLMNVNTFKGACMLAKTEKARAIRTYFIKIESIIHTVLSKPLQPKIIFNQDQINTSKRLVNYYGDKRDIFYMFSFKYLDEWYAKYGIVGEVRDFHERVKQHNSEFKDICFHSVMQCSHINKVESEFKETALVSVNKVKIPKKYGGNHTEIIKLSEIVTIDVIKEEMIKVAGDRMLDPPPRYTQQICDVTSIALEIKKEETKQIEIQEKTKQMEIELKILELKIKAGIL